MAVSTFGIDIDVLREYMPGLPAVPDTTTYPTAAQLSSMVSRKAAKWCARAENQAGVDIVAASVEATAPQIFAIMQECITLDVCIQFAYGRERANPEQIAQWEKQRDDAWARLIDEPGSNGDGQDKSTEAPYIFNSHVTDEADIRRIIKQQSLGVRLASAGRL
jgi:hypothetical protein